MGSIPCCCSINDMIAMRCMWSASWPASVSIRGNHSKIQYACCVLLTTDRLAVWQTPLHPSSPLCGLQVEVSLSTSQASRKHINVKLSLQSTDRASLTFSLPTSKRKSTWLATLVFLSSTMLVDRAGAACAAALQRAACTLARLMAPDGVQLLPPGRAARSGRAGSKSMTIAALSGRQWLHCPCCCGPASLPFKHEHQLLPVAAS